MCGHPPDFQRQEQRPEQWQIRQSLSGLAYVEASHFARRSEPACQSFWDRKAAQTNRIVATKALACKLSKAAWHVMTEDVAFDLGRVFPGRPSNIQIATNK